jgi:hypothetical protein
MTEEAFRIEDLILMSIQSMTTFQKYESSLILNKSSFIYSSTLDVIEELEKAYAFEVTESAKIYLNSMNNYIVDKKSALVYASWVAFCIKQSMLQLFLLTKPIITADLLKVIPMLSKQLMIFIWSATIENFDYNKQTYKSSLIFHNYATSESDLSLT